MSLSPMSWASGARSNSSLQKISTLALLILPLLFGLVGCGNQEPLRLGFVGELTGAQSDLGVHGRDGAQMAVDDLNASGGIAGRPVELIVRNDQGTPAGAQTATQELVDAGVVAIVGHMTSNQTLAGLPVAERAGIVMISPAATTPDLSGKADLFFRVAPTHLLQAYALAQHIYETRGLTTMAGIYDTNNAAYSQSYWDAFVVKFQALGGQITEGIPYSSQEQPDFAPLAAQLKSKNPAGVLIIAAPSDTALIAQNLRLQEWEPATFSSGWGQTETLIEKGGRAVEGLEVVIGYDVNSPKERWQELKHRYEQRFGRSPTFAAGEAYEAVLVLAKALEQTKGEAEGLPQALLTTHNLDGLIGNISLDAYGDVLRTLFLVSVQDGAFHTSGAIEPEAP